MEKINKVFIATSLDGYIADKDGKIDWLYSIDVPKDVDMGYDKFIHGIDAIVMGRTTFETVCSFGIEWSYKKPVFVLSNTLDKVSESYKDKVTLYKGKLVSVLEQIHQNGYYNLYIDGGVTIQNFLKEDLIDEMTITTIPILLGAGTSLFSSLSKKLEFECVKSKLYLNKIVQNHFIRKRNI